MLKIDINKCTGCKMCEVACSFYHTGKINRSLSRIKVSNLYETGIDYPVVCIQCKERYCQECSVNAINIGNQGQVVVSPTVCILCGSCEKKCPIGAIEIFEKIVFVCDLCGGRPQCVEVCTEGAISYIPEDVEKISLNSIKNETKGLNVSEKQVKYIKEFVIKSKMEWRKKNA